MSESLADESPRLLGLEAMAQWLGVRVVWLKRMSTSGLIPCVKADGQVLFDPVQAMGALFGIGGVNPRGRPHKPVEICSVEEFWKTTPFTRKEVETLVDSGELPSFRSGSYRYVNPDLCHALLDATRLRGMSESIQLAYMGYVIKRELKPKRVQKGKA